MAMATPTSGSRSDIRDNAHVALHLLQPDDLADPSHHLPECINLENILPDFDFAGMDVLDFAAPVPASAFNQMLVDSEPSNSVTLQCFDSP
jgi:hypothetical protein